MDGEQFDTIARTLATSSRRRILRVLGSVMAGAVWPSGRHVVGAVPASGQGDRPRRARRFAAPFDRCDARGTFRPEGDRSELQIYEEGFAGRTRAHCDAAAGALGFSVVAYGGTDGQVELDGEPTDPSALGELAEAVVVEFTPAVSGQIRIRTLVQATGVVSAAAGSGILDLPETVEDVLEYFLPTKIGALLDLAKASLEPTHADAVVSTFIDVTGHRDVYGGGAPACATQLKAAAASFTGIFVVFPLSMDIPIVAEATGCEVVVNVEQDRPVRIVAGLSARVRAWGMATAVARVEEGTDREVIVESLSAPPPPQGVTPGGLWVTPGDGAEMVGAIVSVAALAYPTAPQDPPIARVEFTGWWPGWGPKDEPWLVLCTVDSPIADEVYACEVDLAGQGMPEGELTLSFDVYDAAGNRNLGPHGLRTITWRRDTDQDSGCPAGQARCGGACVNLRTDGYHCGACNNRCGIVQICCDGVCGCDGSVIVPGWCMGAEAIC